MAVVIINPKVHHNIRQHLRDGKKIAAIKALRAESTLGLKEAKDAVERLQHEEFDGHYPNAVENASSIMSGPRIKKMVVNMGGDDIEVDLEQMQMMALMDMQRIGLDECAMLLDFVEALKAFSEGAKIGVIEDAD